MLRLLVAALALAPAAWGIGPRGGTSGTSSAAFDPTGLAYSTSVVLKAGDGMTGALTMTNSTITVQGNSFSVGISTFVIVGSSIGVRTASPGAALQVLGDAAFRDGITASSGSFNATGSTQYSAVTSSGINVLNSAGVYAGFFVGSGAGLTNLPTTAGTINTLVGTGTVTSGQLGIGGVNLSSHASGGLTTSSMSLTATGGSTYALNVTSGAFVGQELLVRQLRFIGDSSVQTAAAAGGITAASTTSWTGGNTYTGTNTVTGFISMQGSGLIGVAHGFDQMIASGVVTSFYTMGHTFAVGLSTGESFELEACFQNNVASGASQVNLRFNGDSGNNYSNAMVGVESDDASATVGAGQSDGQIYLAASGLLNGIGTAMGGCTLVTFYVSPANVNSVFTSGKTVYQVTATNIAGMNNNSLYRGSAAITSFAITLGDGTYQWKYGQYKLWKKQGL